MKHLNSGKGLIYLAICLFPALVQAHQVGGGGGFSSGLSHPVLGLDHLLAMISVGILSAQMGGRAVWLVPATFVGVMLAGGLLGINGIPLVSVELGITASVIFMGMALAMEKKLPVFLAMLLVGCFALFHGHAHGTEMPELAEPVLYAGGFVAGTALIHLAGVSIGLVASTFAAGPQFMRYVGAGIAGIGIHLLLG